MATKSTVTATAIVYTPPPDEPTIRLTLDLTMRQAEDILAMYNDIGGHPDCTTRGVWDHISDALGRYGVALNSSRISGDGFDFKK